MRRIALVGPFRGKAPRSGDLLSWDDLLHASHRRSDASFFWAGCGAMSRPTVLCSVVGADSGIPPDAGRSQNLKLSQRVSAAGTMLAAVMVPLLPWAQSRCDQEPAGGGDPAEPALLQLPDQVRRLAVCAAIYPSARCESAWRRPSLAA